VSDTTEVSGSTAASQQIASKRRSYAFGRNRSKSRLTARPRLLSLAEDWSMRAGPLLILAAGRN
jgi:hypothetical protein